MGYRKQTEPMPQEWYTEYHIQKVLRGYKAQPQYIMEGLYVFRWESDFLVKMKSGTWYEVEIKISLSDFKHDFSKVEKHQILKDSEYLTWHAQYFHGKDSDAVKAKAEEWCKGYRHQITDKTKHLYDHDEPVFYTERWEPTKAQRPHFFSYCVPYYLQDKVEPLIPEYAGLLIVTETGILKEVKRPPRLHKEKINEVPMRLEEKFYYNWKHCMQMLENGNKQEEINRLRYELTTVKAEFKAITGYDFKESL